MKRMPFAIHRSYKPIIMCLRRLLAITHLAQATRSDLDWLFGGTTTILIPYMIQRRGRRRLSKGVLQLSLDH